jgi:hypothetical protein
MRNFLSVCHGPRQLALRGDQVSLANMLKITKALDVLPSELFARAETIDKRALS